MTRIILTVRRSGKERDAVRATTLYSEGPEFKRGAGYSDWGCSRLSSGSLKQMSGQCLKSGKNRFVLRPYKFVIH